MLKGRITLPLVLLACLLTSSLVDGSNWTRFRGPNGTGIADDKDIPVRWDLEKNLLWKVPLPGLGHSSPVVWGDRVFVQAASKDTSERQLLCINARDGSTLWKRSIASKAVKNKGKTLIHANNSYASSSPAVDAERVYTVFWDNANLYLHAFTHAGEPVWSKDLGSFTSQHGAGASPIVFEDKVIFVDDQDGKAAVFCFDAKTGNEAWHADRPAFRACYSSPLIRDLPDGKKELVIVSTKGITGYDPHTGDKHWNYVWKFYAEELRTTSSPVMANGGVLLATSGDGGGPRHAIALQLGATPKMLWENRKDFPYVPSALAVGDYFFFVNDSKGGSFAGCYEARTGKRLWLERLGASFHSSPVMIDGKIYAIDEVGDVYVFEANPGRLNLLAKNSLNEQVRSTPAVADNRLYIRGQQHLFCIGKK
jgi:outer membrane protein assembly factor BamB